MREGPVSVGSLAVSVTLKPFEELPDGIHLESVLEELACVLAEAAGNWYDKRGREFCVSIPSVA